MSRLLTVCMAALLFASLAAAGEIRGEYLEARNADVWTGPCFANGEMNIIGNKASMAWKVTEGTFNGVCLNGLAVVAVVYGDNTFGLDKPVKTRTVFLVDQRATGVQREALVGMAKELAGDTIQSVVSVESTPIDMTTAFCDGKGCARLNAGIVKITTRCLNEGDSICGHEDIYYPVLAKAENTYAAYAKEHVFTGKQFDEMFSHGNSRSAVLGGFKLNTADEIAQK